VKAGILFDKGYFGVKMGSGYFENPSKGLPVTLAAILLFDGTTGLPLAVMDGVHITAVRTGAAGGVAAKYLARKGSRVVGVVGTGTQARMQVLALRSFEIEQVQVYGAVPTRRAAYVEEMQKELRCDVRGCITPQEALKGAEICITVTESTTAFVREEWIAPGTHINAIGADKKGKRELSSDLYRKARLVTDNIEIALLKGLFSREEIYAELGELITGEKKGRETDDEITIFDSTGLGIQDISVACLVYEKAKRSGTGTWVEFM
jgi:alanine dehydrogenase